MHVTLHYYPALCACAGQLDRVVQGTVAAEILSACDERMEVMTRLDHLSNPTISIGQALKRANLATFRNFAQQQFQKVLQLGTST